VTRAVGPPPPDTVVDNDVEADAGTGLIGTIAGFLVFLALMLFAVQTLLGLYTRSVVTDAAHEGARRVAGARVDQSDPVARDRARLAAETEVRRLLGHFGDGVALDWSASTDDTVALRVQARPPGFLWDALRGPGAALVERTVTVRVEENR
jgi:Flp pilus assembly protein TadG